MIVHTFDDMYDVFFALDRARSRASRVISRWCAVRFDARDNARRVATR
jgi:hypothetical protein